MKPNVLFVNLPIIPFENVEQQLKNENALSNMLSEPMGILYLSSVLKKNCDIGIVGILDYPLMFISGLKFKSVAEFIQKPIEDITFHPDIISITLTFACSYEFFECVVIQCRKTWSDSVIIVGGIQATNSTQQLMQNKNVDYTVRGEGEIAFPLFVNCIAEARPVTIKGIYSRGNFVPGMELDLCDNISNLDEIPFPDRDLLNMKVYPNWGLKKESLHKSAIIFTSRGCPFHCTFCSSHTVHGRKVRYRSIENVCEEIKELYYKYDINLITPADDLFTSNKERTIRLLHAIKTLNIPDFQLQFPNMLSINTTDFEMMDALVESGMPVANLALESGSEYTQKHIIKKNVNLKKARDIVAYARDVKKIPVRCTLLLGFPRETKELMIESLEFAKSLHADWYLFNIATPLPGSEMYKEFVEMGCIEDGPDTWNKSHYATRFFDTPEMSADELNDFWYRANLDLNFIHNYNFISGNYEKAVELFNDVVNKFPFHIVALYSIYRCYNKMGKSEMAEKTKARIYELIETDTRSKDMFEKYNDLFQEL